MTFRFFLSLLRQAYLKWQKDNAVLLSAALAYYTLFAFAPLLIIATGIAGLVFGRDTTQAYVEHELQLWLGPAGTSFIAGVMEELTNRVSGALATLIGGATLVLAASGLFAQLQRALDFIWHVPTPPRSPIWHVVKKRALTFGMVLLAGFILAALLLSNTAVTLIDSYWVNRFPDGGRYLTLRNFAASCLVTIGLIALIYRLLPDFKIRWRHVWIGASVTGLLLNLGTLGIGKYLGTSSVSSVYGAAGTLVIILLWVYYAAQIFFFGAELTYVYAVARPVAGDVRPQP